MSITLHCKCGAAMTIASDNSETIHEEVSLFRRNHNSPGCKVMSEAEFNKNKKLKKKKKKGKR